MVGVPEIEPGGVLKVKPASPIAPGYLGMFLSCRCLVSIHCDALEGCWLVVLHSTFVLGALLEAVSNAKYGHAPQADWCLIPSHSRNQAAVSF